MAAYSRIAGSASSVSLALFSALAVSAAVIFTGMHQVYGGLSGLSCAALSAILLARIMDHPRQIAVYFVGFAYCAYLLFMGGIASDVGVAGEAHIAGAMSGVVFVLMQRNKWVGSLCYTVWRAMSIGKETVPEPYHCAQEPASGE
jgi:membrane associated rhomboid family serine protease